MTIISSSLLHSIILPVPKKILKLFLKGLLQAYLDLDQHFAASLNDFFVNEEEKYQLSLFCLSQKLLNNDKLSSTLKDVKNPGY